METGSIDPWRDWGGAGVRVERENLGECVRLLMHELVRIRGFGVGRCLHRTDCAKRGGEHATRWQGNRDRAPQV